jgi:transcriptional regulator with XRE-family HTH domain
MRARGRPSTLTGARRYPNCLRELRGHVALSQHAVAAAAGISGAYYGALERGDKRINTDTAERLCRVLGCTVGDLLAGAREALVPIALAVAAADSGERPQSFDLSKPHERLRPGHLTDAGDCVAAEILDDSADLDFARGTLLVLRQVARSGSTLHAGAKVIVRFYLDPPHPGELPHTHEILYGILDRNIVGDLVLITRSRNRRIPRHAVIQSAAPVPSGLVDRDIEPPSRDILFAYTPRSDDMAVIIGRVVYAMGPI